MAGDQRQHTVARRHARQHQPHHLPAGIAELHQQCGNRQDKQGGERQQPYGVVRNGADFGHVNRHAENSK
ncbi:MAG: hypothetical protein ACN6N0_14775 [Microvirgula sp.]